MDQGDHRAALRGQYGRLAAMAVLSFLAMYGLMYAMVDRLGNIHPGLDQAYMAGLMAAPMIVIELALMGTMYKSRRANMAIMACSVVAGLACFAAIRQQILIGDDEFLRAMIPHHSGAILMCRKAPIENAQLRDLCRRIIVGQQAEIAEMDRLLQGHGRP